MVKPESKPESKPGSPETPTEASDFLTLDLLTPERRVLEGGRVKEVTLTTLRGEIQVLPGHAPLVGLLAVGMIRYQTVGLEDVSAAISTGFFEVAGNHVSVLASTLELATEINLSRAKKAQELAEEALRGSDLDEGEFKKYQLKLQRSLVRQSLANQ